MDDAMPATPSSHVPAPSLSGRRAQWAVVGGLALVVAAWGLAAGFRPVWSSWLKPGLVALLLAALAGYYRRFRQLPDQRLPETLDATAVLVAYSSVAAAFSYVVASLGLPPIDATLAAWDRALGFDWIAAYHRASAHPMAAAALKLLYFSLLPQVAVATIALGFLGHARAVREMMGLLIATSLPIVALSGVLPAVSAWIHYGIGVEHAYHMGDFAGLRDGTLRTLAPLDAVGIVTFPSFHTAMALIVVYACRGLAWLFWPAAAVNALVLVSIPPFGGHYLVDMLAGAAVTAAAILWTRRADRLRLPAPVDEPAPGR
jgi:membrane-associated phospholipid phosphatase